MGFAPYFDRNAHAATALLRGLDQGVLRAMLERERIGIAFDATIADGEAHAALDLTIRIVARLYPSISLIGLGRVRTAQWKTIAQSINPHIDVGSGWSGVTKCIVIGESPIPTKVAGAVDAVYVGSYGWLAKVSRMAPRRSAKTANPFGAGAAACIGCANLFRLVFAEQLGHPGTDDDLVVSVLDLTSRSNNNKERPLRLRGKTHLVGAGAIGNGFLWALAHAQASGELIVVDAERLSDSNLQRYVLAQVSEVGEPKASLARTWLKATKVKVLPVAQSWEEYVSGLSDSAIARVAVAVDTAQSRISVQAALPKTTFNSWTQAGEIGVSRHKFATAEACLACLYMPRGDVPNLDEVVWDALRLSPDMLMDVRRRLHTGQPTERAFLEVISQAAAAPLEQLLLYEGKPLRELYANAVCGGAVMEFQNEAGRTAAEVPMAFQSALAGLLLAADVVADAASLRLPLPTITQIDLLRPFPLMPNHRRLKDTTGRCICSDVDFKNVYEMKYGVPVLKESA